VKKLEATDLPEIDNLLHEPARLRLLACLAVVKRADFTFLLKLSGLSRGNLSVQMSKLADAKLVSIEKTFRDNRPRTVYQLTKQGTGELRNYKRDMKTILSALPD
jgi:DNA-binding transcriptional ArsR family regulator